MAPISTGAYSFIRNSGAFVLTCLIMNELASAPQNQSQDQDQPTVWQSALRGLACRCPRCGKGKLYAGFLELRSACESCGLDYAFIDTGDGPAIFIIMIA